MHGPQCLAPYKHGQLATLLQVKNILNPMLRFFRTLRQRLLAENRTSRYLLYAIGEIVLVVIGILIALQINNWNELRLKRQDEYVLLEELYATLIGDLDHQQFEISVNTSSREAIALLLGTMERNEPFTDSLPLVFSRAHNRGHGLIRPHAYEKAKAHGLEFLETDSLKELLTWTYEVNTEWLAELNQRNNLFESESVIPLLTPLFDGVRFTDLDNEAEFRQNKMTPLDFEALKTNHSYLSILRTTDFKRKEFLFFQQRRYRRMLRLQEMLEAELSLKQGN